MTSTKMDIYVKTLSGKCSTINIDSDATVSQLKTKIQSKEGFYPQQQKLIFGGVFLEDTKKLSEYNIKADSVIDMSVSSKKDVCIIL
mmetsp:Transcript_69108/g.84727  ORF Transcript_69108/g.84727 Transcript_69108/m.84727 type:complete len:87 (-) Transcript_69108:37-297(-)